jgi:hypothetical protein
VSGAVGGSGIDPGEPGPAKLLGVTLRDLADLEAAGVVFDLDALAAIGDGGRLPVELLAGLCWVVGRREVPDMTLDDAWALDLGEATGYLGEIVGKG